MKNIPRWLKETKIEMNFIYNFEIFDDAMAELPTEINQNISEDERQEINQLVEVLQTQTAMEIDEKTNDFEQNGPSLHFPKITNEELDKIASKKIAVATPWQTKWAVKVMKGIY